MFERAGTVIILQWQSCRVCLDKSSNQFDTWRVPTRTIAHKDKRGLTIHVLYKACGRICISEQLYDGQLGTRPHSNTGAFGATNCRDLGIWEILPVRVEWYIMSEGCIRCIGVDYKCNKGVKGGKWPWSWGRRFDKKIDLGVDVDELQCHAIQLGWARESPCNQLKDGGFADEHVDKQMNWAQYKVRKRGQSTICAYKVWGKR